MVGSFESSLEAHHLCLWKGWLRSRTCLRFKRKFESHSPSMVVVCTISESKVTWILTGAVLHWNKNLWATTRVCGCSSPQCICIQYRGCSFFTHFICIHKTEHPGCCFEFFYVEAGRCANDSPITDQLCRVHFLIIIGEGDCLSVGNLFFLHPDHEVPSRSWGCE